MCDKQRTKQNTLRVLSSALSYHGSQSSLTAANRRHFDYAFFVSFLSPWYYPHRVHRRFNICCPISPFPSICPVTIHENKSELEQERIKVLRRLNIWSITTTIAWNDGDGTTVRGWGERAMKERVERGCAVITGKGRRSMTMDDGGWRITTMREGREDWNYKDKEGRRRCSLFSSFLLNKLFLLFEISTLRSIFATCHISVV